MNLYISASGIQSHNQWMGVIGTNVSNSGSIGYQKYNFEFADYMYKDTPVGQMGYGSGANTVRRETQSGVPMPSTSSTHVAINGEGYFKVESALGQTMYSRAGIFNFNENGVYSDPQGNAVIGFPITNGIVSTQEEKITLPSTSLPPSATTTIKSQFNLGATVQKSPQSFFESWDNGVPKDSYSQAMNLSVFTASGKKQNLTVYFDIMENANGEKIYEYAFSIPPEDDTRNLPEGSKQKGLLMTGAMLFSSGGTLKTMSALVPSSTPDDLSTWTNAPLSTNGHPTITLPLEGGSQSISIDFGISSGTNTYSASGETNPLLASTLGSPVIQKYASTAYAGNNLVEILEIDGTLEGFLQNIQIQQDGTLRTYYSNGQKRDIYQLNLYTFQATDALKEKGNGLYTYDASVGGAIYTNKPGEGGAGTTQGGYLEQSNVDLALELVNMTLCQNSLSANTKMFGAMNEMLQVAINLKN